MKIEELRVIDGPNYWSVKRKRLVLVKLDLEALEDFPTNKIPGFYDRLKALLPSLYEHRCSEGRPGGFFERVKDGTWMGHVIEHIALEIQTLAGMETGFGRTRGAGRRGLYNVVFSCLEPGAGTYAGKASVRIAEALISGEVYQLQKDIEKMKEIWEGERLGPSTSSIVEEAAKRNIPYLRLDDNSMVQLGYGIHQKRIEATIASTTSSIAVELAGDKKATKRILKSAHVPVPEGGVIESEEDLAEVIKNIGYPVVIKPRDGNQGKGATIGIDNWAEACMALKAASRYSSSIICEKFISGLDFRALVVNYKFIAAALRKPAAVTGDGIHTIQQLIDRINQDARRGNGHENVMTKIKVNEDTLFLLEKKGLALDSILPASQECWLKTTANLSTGGTAADVTESVHPANISLFNRIARIIGLDICGIDVIASDLSTPIIENGGAVIEVNAAPGFRMHLQPSEGKPRNVASAVVDMLFPDPAKATIPIIAVTGTNGKTTTTQLIAHMCMQQGLVTGYTNTEGIYIQQEQMLKGDCSGPASARFILKDPAVEMAVFECARGGILRAGLGFNECDVAVVTNVAEDHLGIGGIDTIEKLARVKAVVAEAVKPGGYCILNADDDLVYEMRNNLDCKVALFSMVPDEPRVISHCESGGLAAIYADGWITILNGSSSIRVEQAARIPLTFDGRAVFNIANAMCATLAAYVSGFSIDSIRQALLNFNPSPECNPGRMNLYTFNDFTVIIDYAHNPHGMRALGSFVKSVEATNKVGIIAGVGDRRDEDLIALGEEAAKAFDELIIRMDKDLRGRTMEDIFQLLNKGIQAGVGGRKVSLIPDEAEAVKAAIQSAKPGCLIVMITEQTEHALSIIRSLLDENKHGENEAAAQPSEQKFTTLKNTTI